MKKLIPKFQNGGNKWRWETVKIGKNTGYVKVDSNNRAIEYNGPSFKVYYGTEPGARSFWTTKVDNNQRDIIDDWYQELSTDPNSSLAPKDSTESAWDSAKLKIKEGAWDFVENVTTFPEHATETDPDKVLQRLNNKSVLTSMDVLAGLIPVFGTAYELGKGNYDNFLLNLATDIIPFGLGKIGKGIKATSKASKLLKAPRASGRQLVKRYITDNLGDEIDWYSNFRKMQLTSGKEYIPDFMLKHDQELLENLYSKTYMYPRITKGLYFTAKPAGASYPLFNELDILDEE